MARVLLVDDEEDLLLIVKEFLELEEPTFELTTCTSGFEALQRLTDEVFDAVVADFQMPGMNGLELLEKLNSAGSDVPFIIFTGKGREQDAIQALNLGADYYVKKGGDPENQYRELAHVIRSVMLHKRTRDALKESEKRYRQLFEDSPISLWEEDASEVKKYLETLQKRGVRDWREYFETNPEEIVKCATMFKVSDVNKATLGFYGAASKEELTNRIVSVFGEDSFPTFKEALIALAEGQTVFEGETVNYSLQGRKLHIDLKLTVVSGYEKSLEKIMVAVVDLTQQKQAEMALRESEEKFRLLADQSLVGIAIIQNEKIVYANEAFSELVGYSIEQMLLWDFEEWARIVHPEDKEFVVLQYRRKQAGESYVVPRYDFQLVTKSGEVVPVTLTARRITLPTGPAVAMSILDFSSEETE
ncbi:MAG: PAS domain S-box protein [Candidatus Thorarchaeota archaeon]